MTARVTDVLQVLEHLAPARLAEDWDNVGLQVGRRDWPVTRVLVALDVTPEVLAEAQAVAAQMLVTHHPLIFRPLKTLDLDGSAGGMLETLVVQRLAVAAAHTNLDSVAGGVNDILAERVGLTAPRVLAPNESPEGGGFGRLGALARPTTLARLAQRVKERMGLAAVRRVGPADLPVRCVAVCSGSGGGLLEAFWRSAADVLITGDLRYHDAREAELRGRGLIDIGHFESEAPVRDVLARRLADGLAAAGRAVEVVVSRVETGPFAVV